MSLTLDELIADAHTTAVEKGWHDDEKYPRSFGDFIALCHSELSEALEEYRNGHDVTEIYYAETSGARFQTLKPEGVPVELADVLIRIFDWVKKYDIPLERALLDKLSFNTTRPARHGGKII